jgi:hypothetical protein
MTLPISKSEKEAVKAELLLGGEGETPEEAAADLASRVIHAFLEARERRDQWLLLNSSGRMKAVPAVGPYPTIAAVKRAIDQGRVHNGGSFFLATLKSPAVAEAHIAEVNKPKVTS